MDITTIKAFLLWSAILNIALLTLWFLFIAFARNWVYRMHSKWYNISEEQFNCIHYAGMLLLKTAIFFFCLCPYFAICIVD